MDMEAKQEILGFITGVHNPPVICFTPVGKQEKTREALKLDKELEERLFIKYGIKYEDIWYIISDPILSDRVRFYIRDTGELIDYPAEYCWWFSKPSSRHYKKNMERVLKPREDK